jgi:hypothetical protein
MSGLEIPQIARVCNLLSDFWYNGKERNWAGIYGFIGMIWFYGNYLPEFPGPGEIIPGKWEIDEFINNRESNW